MFPNEYCFLVMSYSLSFNIMPSGCISWYFLKTWNKGRLRGICIASRIAKFLRFHPYWRRFPTFRLTKHRLNSLQTQKHSRRVSFLINEFIWAQQHDISRSAHWYSPKQQQKQDSFEMPPKDETQKLAEPEREKEKKLAVEEHSL